MAELIDGKTISTIIKDECKEKVAEYVAQGIDKTIAQVMAKTFYEYGI